MVCHREEIGASVSRIETGSLKLTPEKDGDAFLASSEVTFSAQFSTPPTVLTNPRTGSPHAVNTSATSVSTEGFIIWLARENTIETTVDWVAIGR